MHLYTLRDMIIIEGLDSITRCAHEPAQRALESMKPTLDVHCLKKTILMGKIIIKNYVYVKLVNRKLFSNVF